MAKNTIGPLDFSRTLSDILAHYGDEVYNVVEECIDEVAEEAKNRLQAVNHWKNEGSGDYAGSWINEKLQSKPLTVSRAVHNEKHYRLSHLLEKGHVIRNGTGRTFGRSSAYPHIRPVNDWANEELVRLVKRRIEG